MNRALIWAAFAGLVFVVLLTVTLAYLAQGPS